MFRPALGFANCHPAGTKLRAVLALLLSPDAPGAGGESSLWAAPAVRWPAAALLDMCVKSLTPCVPSVTGSSSACPARSSRSATHGSARFKTAPEGLACVLCATASSWRRLASEHTSAALHVYVHRRPTGTQVLARRRRRRRKPQHRRRLGGALCSRQLRGRAARQRACAAAAARRTAGGAGALASSDPKPYHPVASVPQSMQILNSCCFACVQPPADVGPLWDSPGHGTLEVLPCVVFNGKEGLRPWRALAAGRVDAQIGRSA